MLRILSTIKNIKHIGVNIKNSLTKAYFGERIFAISHNPSQFKFRFVQ